MDGTWKDGWGSRYMLGLFHQPMDWLINRQFVHGLIEDLWIEHTCMVEGMEEAEIN